MEGHHIPRGGPSSEPPGPRNGVHEFLQNFAIPTYPRNDAPSVAPPAPSGMAPASAGGGGYPMYHGAGFSSSPSMNSHYSAFLDHHRAFGMIGGPAQGFNGFGPAPLPYRGDRPAPTQNAPLGPHGSQYQFFGGNGPPSSNGSSFTPSLYDSGHDFYNGPPSIDGHGSPSPDERRLPSFEGRGYPGLSDYMPPGSYDGRPPNYMAASGPIDRSASVLAPPLHNVGSLGIVRAVAPDIDSIPLGPPSYSSLSSDSKQCEDNDKAALFQGGAAFHSSLSCQQAPEPIHPSLKLQSQGTPWGETCAQQLASAVRQGLTFNEYQEIHGKAIDEPEQKEDKSLSINLAKNHGPGTGEPLGDGSSSGVAIPLQSHDTVNSDQKVGREVDRDSRDAEGLLGSLMAGQKGRGAAAGIQTRPRLYSEPANTQHNPRTSLPNSNAQYGNTEGEPAEAPKFAAGGGPKSNPTTPTRRRPNQAQRRQSRRQSDLLTGPAPTAVVTPQTPQRGYLRDRNGPRKPPGSLLNTQQGQPDYRPGHPQHFTNQHHLQQPGTYELQQPLAQTQQAHFARAGAADHGFRPQRKQADSRGSYLPTMPAQARPRQPHQQQRGSDRIPMSFEEIVRIQSDYLAGVASVAVAKAAVDPQEMAEKEAFRLALEEICRDAISQHEAGLPGGDAFNASTIRLECFGSLSSGFATKSSDMDLVLLSPLSHPPLGSKDSPIPRLLEKRLLDLGLGARFLTKTRVPIMKLCEKPTAGLLDLLRKAREKWEAGEDNSTTTGEKDTDSTFALSLSQDMGKTQQMSPTTPVSHGDTDSQESKEAKSPAYRLQQLKQNPKETLWAYNSRARKLFRTFGGRDIALRHENLQSSDLELLVTATEAFVDGILDENMRKVVKASLPKHVIASLYGVWLLAEGEQQIKRWEDRKIHELTGEKEAQGNKLIREWRQLQIREGITPAQYNEALRKVLEQIQQLPSLKLLSLAQRQDELADAYGIRATINLEELGGVDCDPGMWQDQLSPSQRTLLELVIRQYIEGVYDLTLRKEVRRTSLRRNVSLADVISIHLAELSIQKYKSGISIGMYSSEEQEILKEHAQLVRLYGLRSDREDVRAILEKMKGIPDPSPSLKQRDFVDALEFPKTGVGIQCDINFSNLLALYNTALLRCYSHSDPRVHPMVIFVKAWAKTRKINSPYHGTLSSYGYVLLVLHYLLNVASPPVLTNLQHAWEFSEREFRLEGGLCEGYDVRFWCDEEEIKRLACLGQFTRNKQPLGVLLRGFFEYYSHQGPHVIKNGFVWNLNVVSIRTQGGLLSKQVKGWTEAKTVSIGGKEVRQRYLLAIEDPFEIDHNVGRTVTYHGIVAIRDELRRAWRIINSLGRDHKLQEDLFEEVVEMKAHGEKASPKDTDSQKTGAGAQN